MTLMSINQTDKKMMLRICKSILLWDSILHLSEWLGLITQVTAHFGEDVGQGEHSPIVGGSVNLYRPYGN